MVRTSSVCDFYDWRRVDIVTTEVVTGTTFEPLLGTVLGDGTDEHRWSINWSVPLVLATF